jgi:hypothetical protein
LVNVSSATDNKNFYQCRTLIGCSGNAPNLFITGGFQYVLQDHRRLSVIILSAKIGNAGFCENGYLHDFQD